MTRIKFGTDGWRAIIAEDFTVENVARVTEGVVAWLDNNARSKTVVVGHDCRFAGQLFAETVAKVLAYNGIKVYLGRDFVSTPMVSLGTKKFGADLGIIITASHNPPGYNGYKLKGDYGGPLLPEKVQEIENNIPKQSLTPYRQLDINKLIKEGKIEIAPLEDIYVKHIEENFDLDAIRDCGLNFAYDAMYGAGQRVMRRLFPDITFLHCDYNPSFDGLAPEPIAKNLREFSELMRLSDGEIACGLATDGDADRIGLIDKDGSFVDSHHIILLLIHYLAKYKGMKGKIATAFSTTSRIKKMCEHYNLPLDVVKIGFKYICGIMLREDVLLGGEESGGIAIKGHIPERDGIWIGLTIWEFMAKSGKSLRELIQEVYDITGQFWFERNDLHLSEELKSKIITNCKEGKYREFGPYKVERVEDLDGYKYFFNNDEWLMIRASGTEPVLRTYAESYDQAGAFKILEAFKTVLN